MIVPRAQRPFRGFSRDQAALRSVRRRSIAMLLLRRLIDRYAARDLAWMTRRILRAYSEFAVVMPLQRYCLVGQVQIRDSTRRCCRSRERPDLCRPAKATKLDP